MVKIYLVERFYDYEGSKILGAYSDKIDAETHVNEWKKNKLQEQKEVLRDCKDDTQKEFWSEEIEELPRGFKWHGEGCIVVEMELKETYVRGAD